MLTQELVKIHPVQLVSRENEVMGRLLGLEVEKILPDRVGRSFVPAGMFKGLFRGEISTKPPEKVSKLYALATCMWSEAELNWVRMYIWLNPELIQFDMGISTIRCFPPKGTAVLTVLW